MKIGFSVSSAMALILIMLFMQLLETKAKYKDKKTSFECGFDSMTEKKLSFSTNFMLLLMMFLIFDVEISILIPFMTMNKLLTKSITMMFNFFILALTFLMVKEWAQGSMEWNF